MIAYVDNSSKSTKKLLELISSFSNVVKFKVNIQNQLYFYVLATNNWKWGKILFIIVQKNVKYFDINLISS